MARPKNKPRRQRSIPVPPGLLELTPVSQEDVELYAAKLALQFAIQSRTVPNPEPLAVTLIVARGARPYAGPPFELTDAELLELGVRVDNSESFRKMTTGAFLDEAIGDRRPSFVVIDGLETFVTLDGQETAQLVDAWGRRNHIRVAGINRQIVDNDVVADADADAKKAA